MEGWQKQDNSCTRFLFSGPTPGPTTPSTGQSASACFGRFFTDEVWDLPVEETNRYAAECRGSQSARRPWPWHDVTREEMKAFVGMLMVMGVCRLPRIENYWCTSYPLFTPQLREVMPLVRFQQIYRYLHLADSTAQVPHGQPRYDPLPLVPLYACNPNMNNSLYSNSFC